MPSDEIGTADVYDVPVVVSQLFTESVQYFVNDNPESASDGVRIIDCGLVFCQLPSRDP